MEGLHHLFKYATANGFLSPLAPRGLTHQLSFFADDVMLLLKPESSDLEVCTAILHDFGVAYGLWINPTKCSVVPIRCSDDQLCLIRAGLGFRLEAFPIKYPGLPLTKRKPSASQFQDLLDGIAGKLPTWRAATLDKVGQLNLVQSVLCAMPVHVMFALDVHPKVLLKIIRICCGFLWAGAADAREVSAPSPGILYAN